MPYGHDGWLYHCKRHLHSVPDIAEVPWPAVGDRCGTACLVKEIAISMLMEIEKGGVPADWLGELQPVQEYGKMNDPEFRWPSWRELDESARQHAQCNTILLP